MSDNFEEVDVWIAIFPNREAFDSYLVESYSSEPETDHLPISSFAADQGETFYDHDFFESSFHEAKGSLLELLKGHSFIERFQDKAQQTWFAQGSVEANSIFLLFGRQIESPVSVSTEDYQLIYLGRFDCCQ